jgi:holo-[acyl-carrier protein] synthase
MIVGMGTDLAEVGRIRAAVERFGERFLQRIYTEGEVRYAMSKANAHERLAGRFAAKEAAMKALGTGVSRGVRWKDIEVGRESSGKPVLRLFGAAAAIAERLGVSNAVVSITHTEEMAMAVVVLEKPD